MALFFLTRRTNSPVIVTAKPGDPVVDTRSDAEIIASALTSPGNPITPGMVVEDYFLHLGLFNLRATGDDFIVGQRYTPWQCLTEDCSQTVHINEFTAPEGWRIANSWYNNDGYTTYQVARI